MDVKFELVLNFYILIMEVCKRRVFSLDLSVLLCDLLKMSTSYSKLFINF
eukprot:UN14227